MSSSNLVRMAVIKETTYGVTPGSGNFKTARFISESLSGTPDTVESQQIRTDRMGSGQIVTGLTVGGDVGFELAKESALEDFMASAMFNDWDTLALVTVDMDIDATAKEISRASGSFVSDGLKKGDFVTLAGFDDAVNNVVVMLTSVSALTLGYVGPEGMVDGSGTTTTYKRADKLSIGTAKKSFSIEKAFLDLTTKAIIYRGMIVGSMELNIAFGELVKGSFSFSGNDYKTVSTGPDFITNGRTVDPAATTTTLNGSVDMPFLASAALGALDTSNFDLQSVSIKLNNNLSAQNVIGDIAPKDYSAGTAAIEMGLSAYLNNDSWSILGKKLSQEAFALAFMMKNLGGWYGFYLPAVQVSFPDPSSPGQNQDILLDMTGTAKVGDSGESALTIYRNT